MSDKELLMDAITGFGVENYEQAKVFTEVGAMRFTGNQHNEDWAWNRDWLERCSVEQLRELYEFIKSAPQN